MLRGDPDMATNWNTLLASITNAADILAILKKILPLLDGKVDSTAIDELLAELNKVAEDGKITIQEALEKVDFLDQRIDERTNAFDDAIAAAAAAGAGANGWTDLLIQTEDGSTQRDINERSLKNGEYAPILGERSIRLQLKYLAACLRYGLNDPLPLDNNTNMFRGLTNKDAWADENLGVGSVAFGRNGCSKAYLTTTFGHDCITYGVASMAGGAGSGTGNPDDPDDGATYGYCALAFGKDTAAIGRISTAFGQNNKATTIHSFASGYESETGKGLTTHPVLDGIAVDDDGDCAYTHGFRAFAYGNYSLALGNFVRAYHGSKVIGSGINAGSLLEGLVPKSIVLGANVDIPTVILTEGDVVANGAFGKVGFNTKYKPRERVEVVLKDGDKVAIRSSNNTATGGGSLDLQGTLGNGDSASIFRIEYTSPNTGSAFGVTTFYQNSNKFMNVNESGDPTFTRILNSLYGYQVDGISVIGGQMPAIADLPHSATLEDVIATVNTMLAALRAGSGHGLIAK